MLLFEHIRIAWPDIGMLIDLVNPLVIALIDTHINCRTIENVRRAGLTIESIEDILGDLIKLITARP